jgi:ABC-type uncharacterized transport system permease subunit
MSDGYRLYIRYLGISIRSQMQYRASFVMLTFGHFFITASEFAGMVILFDRFGRLGSWRLEEVALFYGLINIAFALADAASRGFDTFGSQIKSGDFDRILPRPRSAALQIAGQELTLRRIGRLAQGLFVFLWAAHTLDLEWTLARTAMTILAIFGAAAIFGGLVVLQATLAFWTIESLEIMKHSHLRRCRDGPIPIVDLPRLVQTFLHLRRPPRFRQLLPGSGHLGEAGLPGCSLAIAHRRRLFSFLIPPYLALRRPALHVHRQLNLPAKQA